MQEPEYLIAKASTERDEEIPVGTESRIPLMATADRETLRTLPCGTPSS